MSTLTRTTKKMAARKASESRRKRPSPQVPDQPLMGRQKIAEPVERGMSNAEAPDRGEVGEGRTFSEFTEGRSRS